MAAIVLVRVRRWIFSRRNSSEIFFFAIGYLAASHGPTWRTLVACSSTTCDAPSGGALSVPSTTTHVPVDLQLVDGVHLGTCTTHLEVLRSAAVVELEEDERALVRDAAGLDPSAHDDGGSDQRRAVAGARVDGGDADAIVQLGVGVHDLGSERAGAVGGGRLGLHRSLNRGELRFELAEVHISEGGHDVGCARTDERREHR